jgi:cytochrome c oxidase subunit 1
MSSTAAHHDAHHEGPPSGLLRWVFTTNHKDIGTLYLIFSLIMFFIGGVMALVIRPSCSSPACRSSTRSSLIP